MCIRDSSNTALSDMAGNLFFGMFLTLCCPFNILTSLLALSRCISNSALNIAVIPLLLLCGIGNSIEYTKHELLYTNILRRSKGWLLPVWAMRVKTVLLSYKNGTGRRTRNRDRCWPGLDFLYKNECFPRWRKCNRSRISYLPGNLRLSFLLLWGCFLWEANYYYYRSSTVGWCNP